MTHLELCQALFEAFPAGDEARIRELCHPDLQAQQNANPPIDLDTVVGLSRAVNALVKDFRYEEARRSATADGFVEEHFVRGTLPDGSTLDIAICVVADVRGGQVRVLREYFDTAAAAGLIAALS